MSFQKMPLLLQGALCVLILTAIPLTGCSKKQEASVSDLAVAQMSQDDVQANGFLRLNADKPGQSVDVMRYLVRGKYNVVEYFSPYDQVSVELEPRLIQLTQMRTDLAVRTVNVNRPQVQGIDWQSPILADLRTPKLPYFMIFDPAGQLRAQGRPAFEQVKQWVQ